MTNTKKKVDPEALQQQFEQWKESTEYKKWEEMSESLKKYTPVTETTLDINGAWQEFFDELMKFFQVMKVKTGKIKEIRHEHIRSFFFAHEDKENEKIIIDGILCGVTKEHADRSWTLRHKFCDILKAFCNQQRALTIFNQENTVLKKNLNTTIKINIYFSKQLIEDIEDLDFENFQANKKNLQKSINEFFKYFNPHVKSGHKEIYESKIAKVLEPLNNLIQINTLLVNLNKKLKTDMDRETQSFKVKAITEKYCIAFEEVQRILLDESKEYKLFAKCDFKRTFYKLSYKGWANNPCEKLYLQPLSDNFVAMQKELMQLFAYDINYWKIPLAHNEDLVREIEKVIKAELISDRLMGTPLRRELFNFVYKVIQIIQQAHPYLESNLLKKDENSMNCSIPKLVVFKLIQHMRLWKDRKQQNERSIEERTQRLQAINKMKDEQKNYSLINKIGKSESTPSKKGNTSVVKDASFFNSSNIQTTTATHGNNVLNTSMNLSLAAKDEVKDNQNILDDLTPRKADTSMINTKPNDTSMLNASITTSATYNSAVYHTSTKQKMLKSVSATLPVKTLIKSPSNRQEVFNFVDDIENKIEDQIVEMDLQTYGRYFYLEGYISEENMKIFEYCVDEIQRLNPAVQQDIEDYIVLQGFTPKFKDRYDQQRVESRLKLEKLQESEYSDQKINSTRPPELWNFPEAIQKHKFRSIAKPKECYIDGRFEQFDEKLDILAQNLISYKPESWREIVSRVIDVFAESYNKEITAINPAEILG